MQDIVSGEDFYVYPESIEKVKRDIRIKAFKEIRDKVGSLKSLAGKMSMAEWSSKMVSLLDSEIGKEVRETKITPTKPELPQ